MASELWARNPHTYIRECRETDTRLFAWDRGLTRKYHIDPQRHALAWLGDVDFRAMAIGDQGAVEYDRTHGTLNPAAVYPVWEYGQASFDLLERWVSEDCTEQLRDRALRLGRPIDETPVLGQEHRVVVVRPPHAQMGLGKSFLATLGLLQADFPECIIHVHGYSTFRWIGSNIRSGDFNARWAASQGKVVLPNGRIIVCEDAAHHLKWVSLLGWKCADLQVPRNRCMFSLHAAKWAAATWDTRISAISPRARTVVNEEAFADILNNVELEQGVEIPPPRERKKAPTPSFRPARIHGQRKDPSAKPLVGDRFFCEACTFASTCRSFRVGSICSLPDSEATELAHFFKTRDSDMIIEGLTRLIEGDIERAVEGRRIEQANGELDPHVTKMRKQVFDQGVTLAKLVDPKLRSAAVAVQVNGGNGQLNVTTGADQKTINARVADAYAALERAGVPGPMITETMLRRCLALGTTPEALQQVVVEEAAQYQLPVGLIDVNEVP